MAQIKSRKHQRTASFVALAATLPLMAHATTATEEVTQLPEITVKSQAENKYKTNQLSSAKQTQPLVDTPQTVSVINQTLLKEQGATSLVEALRNTPGITLQMGKTAIPAPVIPSRCVVSRPKPLPMSMASVIWAQSAAMYLTWNRLKS